MNEPYPSYPVSPRMERRRRLAVLVCLCIVLALYGWWAYPRVRSVDPTGSRREDGNSSLAADKNLDTQVSVADSLTFGREENLPLTELPLLKGSLSIHEGKAVYSLYNGSSWEVSRLLLQVTLSTGSKRSLLLVSRNLGRGVFPASSGVLEGVVDFSQDQVEHYKIIAAQGRSSGISGGDNNVVRGTVFQFAQASDVGILVLIGEDGKRYFFKTKGDELALPEGEPQVGDKVTVRFKRIEGGLKQALSVVPFSGYDDATLEEGIELSSSKGEEDKPLGPSLVKDEVSPLSILYSYYTLLSQGRLDRAVALREAGYRPDYESELFDKAKVEIKDVTLLEQTGSLALLRFILTVTKEIDSPDASEHAVKVQRFRGKLVLGRGLGGWRIKREFLNRIGTLFRKLASGKSDKKGKSGESKRADIADASDGREYGENSKSSFNPVPARKKQPQRPGRSSAVIISSKKKYQSRVPGEMQKKSGTIVTRVKRKPKASPRRSQESSANSSLPEVPVPVTSPTPVRLSKDKGQGGGSKFQSQSPPFKDVSLPDKLNSPSPGAETAPIWSGDRKKSPGALIDISPGEGEWSGDRKKGFPFGSDSK